MDETEGSPKSPEAADAKSHAENGNQDGFRVPSMIPSWKNTASKPVGESVVQASTTEGAEDDKKHPSSISTESAEALQPEPTSAASQSSVSSIQTTSMASSTSVAASSKMARPDLKAPPPPPLSYNEPRWSNTPPQPYFLTVIKNGTVISEIPISQKPFHVFGRLPSCDIQLEHPSISRHHAILQYRPRDKGKGDSEGEEEASSQAALSSSMSVNPTEEGFYVYDLGSTHGTFINKTKIQTRCYYRLRIGQMVKFGGSSRLFLLEIGSGSQEEVEEAAKEEIREIVEHKEAYEKRKAELEAERRRAEKEKEDMGVMWGMVIDDMAGGVEGEGEEYEIDEEREAYYKDDPKKALKKFFDREGLEFEYEVEEEGKDRVYTARVRLPMDTATGEAVYAEASVRGKKKDAVFQCALNACRMLDAQDILRHSAPAYKRKQKNWEENDYYDSDEDTFLDRTGIIERKRKKRMQRVGVEEAKADNLQTLESKLEAVEEQITSIRTKLDRNNREEELQEGVDPLEAYMSNVGGHLDKAQKTSLKHQLQVLNKEQVKLTKLIEMVKPTNLPELVRNEEPAKPSQDSRSAGASVRAVQTSSRDQEDSMAPASLDPPVAIEKNSLSNSELDHKQQQQQQQQPSPTPSGPKRKRPRRMGPAMPTPGSIIPSTTKKKKEEDEASARDLDNQKEDEDYASWLPPEKQTGDGKTHLNEKFGY